MKKYILEYFIGIIVSCLLLVIYIVLPDIVSESFAGLVRSSIWFPVEFLFGGQELQRWLTVLIFGKMTPNFAPIQLILYFLTWPIILFAFIRLFRWWGSSKG